MCMYVGTHDFKYCFVHLSIKIVLHDRFSHHYRLYLAHVALVPLTTGASVLCACVSFAAIVISIISSKFQQSNVELSFHFRNFAHSSQQKRKKKI